MSENIRKWNTAAEAEAYNKGILDLHESLNTMINMTKDEYYRVFHRNKEEQDIYDLVKQNPMDTISFWLNFEKKKFELEIYKLVKEHGKDEVQKVLDCIYIGKPIMCEEDF